MSCDKIATQIGSDVLACWCQNNLFIEGIDSSHPMEPKMSE